MYLVFTRIPAESYGRPLRSLLLCLCDVFRAPINSLLYWFGITQIVENSGSITAFDHSALFHRRQYISLLSLVSLSLRLVSTRRFSCLWRVTGTCGQYNALHYWLLLCFFGGGFIYFSEVMVRGNHLWLLISLSFKGACFIVFQNNPKPIRDNLKQNQGPERVYGGKGVHCSP